MGVDLNLNAFLTPQGQDIPRGVDDFVSLLTLLHSCPGFDVDWVVQEGEHSPRYSVWNNREDFRRIIEARNRIEPDLFNAWSIEASDPRLYSINMHWNGWDPDRLSGEIYQPHPRYGTQPEIYIGMIDAVTRWKRPQHLAFGPMVYLRDHHPLDRARAGIRWMGWLPFDLHPSDVPEAELVRPMNGGVLVVTQMAFWQAWDANPAYSRDAIERAQDVEIRLNLLGVLPTNIELERGDWGVRPQAQ